MFTRQSFMKVYNPVFLQEAVAVVVKSIRAVYNGAIAVTL